LAADANTDPEAAGFRGITLAHNARSPEAVDRIMEEAESAGARVVKRARELDWGGYSGYFSDPDGFLWEAGWNPHFWTE
jgi:uncharacterized glyoxalase superfamily protein PhnB